MIYRINKLIKNNMVKNVLVLSSGTIIAQLFSFIFTPFITRIYGPESYGIMSTFNSFVNLIVPIVALTYPLAIVLPKDNNDAIGIIRISFKIVVLISFFLSFVLLVLKDDILRIFNLGEIQLYILLVPLPVFFGGCLQIIEQWLIRTKQFKTIARVTGIQSLLLQSLKIGIGKISPTASSLIIISSLSNALKVLLLMKNYKKKTKKISWKTQQQQKLKKIAQEYIDFPLYRAPQVFLNEITQNLPILLLSTFFGPTSTGFYSLSRTLLNLPMTLISKSVGDVFYPRITEAAANGENLTKLIKKATFTLAIIGILPFIFIIIFGPFLFSIVFGREWVKAGEYARWMSLWVFFSFISQPCIRAFPILKMQSFHLKYTIISFIIRALMLGIGNYAFSNEIVSISLYSIAGSLLYIYQIGKTIKISKKYPTCIGD